MLTQVGTRWMVREMSLIYSADVIPFSFCYTPVQSDAGTKWHLMQENNVWGSSSSRLILPPDFNLIEHLWKILEWCAQQRSPPPSSKHQMKEWCSSLQLLKHIMLFFSFFLSVTHVHLYTCLTTTCRHSQNCRVCVYIWSQRLYWKAEVEVSLKYSISSGDTYAQLSL